MAIKLLLDTDIGSDIDDAVCLAYLLAQPKCDLLGITTVTGEAVKRAQMASALCKLAGKRVPIYPGAETPLLVPQKQPQAQQATALARWKHEARFPMNEAVDFLRRTIRKHPGEITLLTIGPLTNIGLLFALDPEIPRLLKQIVLMCGVYGEGTERGVLEWNAMVDPHATAIVYHAPVKAHRSVGLDVTLQVTMPAEEVRSRFTHRLLQPVLDFAEVWFKSADQITFHDPLAAATIFDPRICTFQRGAVTVELDNPDQRGRTLWQAGAPKGRHAVAVRVDAPRFFRHYFSVFR
ncbi:MAG: nucleoside hydrolase [Anaerolineae bacterium]|nr:nucleoside hydrolase [Thermoflexales bacterium]MDW8406897.1 nucleoside hydrolase [Anaerolineae bacterium]